MQELEEGSGQEKMVPNSLYCERVIPVFVHGKKNKKENHVFSAS